MVQLEDGAVYTGCEAEIVGINDELLHLDECINLRDGSVLSACGLGQEWIH